MKLTNFTFDTSIEIGVTGRHRFLDLHNCFDWQSMTYISEAQRIKMAWIRSTGDWVQPGLPPSLVLEFRGVSRLSACPRDAKLPYSEDSCLASVSFTPPEYASDYDHEFPEYRDESEHLTFRFQSGFGLKIWAAEAELQYARNA